MATLFRRSNGYYYLLTYVHGRRVWQSTGCKVQSEALKYIAEQRRKPKESSTICLSQFQTQFLAFAETNFARSTVELYKSGFRKLGELIGDYPIAAYTPQMVEQFKTLRLHQVSPVKTNIDFRVLRAAFNTANRWGIIESNPFTKCKQVRVPPKRPVYLSPEEFRKILEVIDKGWFRDILRFAVSTMMRVGEIVNLKWSSVDLDRRLILVENTNEFSTKTHKIRAIPMDEWVSHMMKNKERKADLVFTHPDGQALTVGYVSSRFKKWVRKTEIGEEIHFHSLRHTGATWLVQKDVPIYSVQQILGHSRIEMTQIYSHLDVEHLRKPMEKILETLN